MIKEHFALLFVLIFDEYEKILKHHKVPIPSDGTQETIMGYHEGARIKGTGINKHNYSLSHVIYFELLKHDYDFTENGITPDKGRDGYLFFQGQCLVRAYRDYQAGRPIELSENYYKAYCFFLEKRGLDFDQILNDPDTEFPQELTLYDTLKKTRQPSQTESKFEPLYDIYLASPKLTLGRKINLDYEKFRRVLLNLLGKYFTKIVENAVIRHFFGFLPENLSKEYESFEDYLNKLRVALKEAGFEVYDSRQAKSEEDIYDLGSPTDQLALDMYAIKRSKAYLLISPYPRLFSSAWTEAGMALAWGKPCLFICKDRRRDLPFILRDKNSNGVDIQVREYRGLFEKAAIEHRVKTTVKLIKEWSAFRCETCNTLDHKVERTLGMNPHCQCGGLGYTCLGQPKQQKTPDLVLV